MNEEQKRIASLILSIQAIQIEVQERIAQLHNTMDRVEYREKEEVSPSEAKKSAEPQNMREALERAEAMCARTKNELVGFQKRFDQAF